MEHLTKKELIAKKHDEERYRFEQKEKRKKMMKWVIIAALILVFGGGLVWIIKASSKPLPGTEVADQGRGHISKAEQAKFKYNSNPPTSGPHDSVWTNAGIYGDPQDDGLLVHSLEHGYVILSYNCSKFTDVKTCETLKKQLADIANQKLWKIIVIPRPQLDVPLALTAWDRIEKFKTIGTAGLTDDQKTAIQVFIDELRDHGPEQTPN